MNKSLPHSKILILGYVVFFFMAFPSKSQSQDWQTLYNQAVAKYQSEDFQNSLLLAEEALPKAPASSPTSKAYTLQLITSNCEAIGDAERGLKYIDEEIKSFQQIEGAKSKSLAEAQRKEIIFLQQKDQIKKAIEKSTTALKSFSESYGNEAIQTVLFNVLVGDLSLASGDSLNAKKYLEQSIPLLASNAEAKDDYKTVLFNAASLDERLKDKVAAEKKYADLISFLQRENQTSDPEFEESKKGLARLNQQTGSGESSPLRESLKNAVALQSQNQIDKAIEEYKKCLSILKQNSAKDKTAFSVYFNYARVLIDQGSLSEAGPLLQQAQQLAQSVLKPDDLESLLVKLADADLTLSLGQNKEAVAKYNSLTGRANKFPKSVPYLINSCNQLLTNNLSRTAVNLLKPIVCCSSKELDQNMFMKASLTYCNALLAESKPDSVVLFLNQPYFERQLWSEFKKVEALQLQGQWPLALEKLSKLESLASNNDEKGQIAFHVAELAHKMGDYIKAEENYSKAKKYFEPNNPAESWQMGNSLAILYSKMGNFDKSEKILNTLLAKVPKSNPIYLALLSNLSANYIDTNELEKASGIQEQIISIEKELVGEDHPEYGQAINNSAVLYQREGRYADAKNLMEQALKISKNNYGEQSIDYALKESAFGAILKDAGDLGRAQTTLIHAEKILADKIGRAHPDYISCEYNLAMVLQRNGNAAQALPWMKHLAEAYKKEILDFFPAMSEQEQVAFFNKVNKAIQDYQQFAIEQGNQFPELIDQLFDFRLATKALLLNSSTKIRERILQGADQQLKSQFISWISLRDQIGKIYSSGQAVSEADHIAKLEAKANELEKNLALGSSAFKRDKLNREITWKKIQASLPDKEAAIEFIRVKPSGKSDSIAYAALILRKDVKVPQLIVLTGGKKKEGREFGFYKNSIMNRFPNNRSYGVYWKPLENALKGVDKIYYSADGVYNKINPATLFDPDQKEFLSNKYQFTIVSSLRDLINQSNTSGFTKKTAQLFCPVDFNGGVEPNHVLRSFSPENVSSLPGTKVEVEKLDNVLKASQWNSASHVGKEASEYALKNLKPTEIIHIATHGFFVETPKDENQVVLGSGQKDNPLLRSGLLLPSDNAEDGFLTSYEVKNMNFEDTDLVVLSACETGTGEIRNGEGVYGLQRAFLIGGVKNILMSLWKVDDAATQELMVLFYQNLLAGKSKSDALRQAQIELMKKYTDPFFWGSFVLISKPN